jgi:hypothetical protein
MSGPTRVGKFVNRDPISKTGLGGLAHDHHLGALAMLRSQRRRRRSRRQIGYSTAVSTDALETRPKLLRQRWFLTIKWIVGSAITLLGAVAAVVGIWGPPWPTGPEIHPTGLDLAKPLTVPFDFVNKSLVFPIHIRAVGCGFLNEFILHQGGKFTTLLEIHDADMTIPPHNQIPYGCYVNLNLYEPTAFEMCFVVVYEPSWLEFWKNQNIIYKTDTFFWQNGHWTEGAKLKRTTRGTYEEDKTGCEISPPLGLNFMRKMLRR